MAKRTLQIERRKKGFFGYLFLVLFVASQCFMLYACIGGVMKVAEEGQQLTGDAKIAHDAGAGIGIMLLMFLWAAVTIVFGGLAYATRGKKIIETVEQE